MIRFNPDCLLFKVGNGQTIPCAAEAITIELIGENATHVDVDTVKQAAAAVLHYFKMDKQMESVTVGEFSSALEQVLRQLGLEIKALAPPMPHAKVVEVDLRRIAFDAGKGFELFFFQQLRQALDGELVRAPRVLRFNGLRGCVKQLSGAQRWNGRCQRLSDQIVDYLRECLDGRRLPEPCALVVL